MKNWMGRKTVMSQLEREPGVVLKNPPVEDNVTLPSAVVEIRAEP